MAEQYTESQREANRRAAEARSRKVETAKDFRAPLKATKTGRGMLPGETPEQWRKRLKKMDEEAAAEEKGQKKALEEM
jgi:hypothetical protein